ncbi:hypothetical protein FRB93_001541 [Tulasnella sp. JGI-2019a]|nr:hypothetical protein FRB93_001541 [Tulasnella sp. JGI-2019a]
MTGSQTNSIYGDGTPYNNWAHGEETDLTADLLDDKAMPYKDGSSIDWMYEEAIERAHKQRLKSQPGLRGLLMPIMETWRLWTVLILTGIFVGYTGGTLDVLVAWLSDLRMGLCTYGYLYNQAACCSGLDAGEVCGEWVTWSERFGIQSTAGQALVQCFVYVTLAVGFATSAAALVQFYAPYAFHTGIPEIKAILSGYVLDEFLSPWTLLIKALGLALAVASGLSLGKEGPLVHVSCCAASLFLSLLGPKSKDGISGRSQNESQRRKTLAAAATAGVAVAFGSPLGGVLFGLEELDSTLFSNEQLMWRAFVTSAVAATTLSYVDPFGIGKLVLFQVTTSQQWRQFELVPWLGLGVAGGLIGALLIKLNVQVAIWRRHGPWSHIPLFEVAVVSAATAIISWPASSFFLPQQTHQDAK